MIIVSEKYTSCNLLTLSLAHVLQRENETFILSGKCLLTQNFNSYIKLGHIEKGIYLLKIETTEGKTIQAKILKK